MIGASALIDQLLLPGVPLLILAAALLLLRRSAVRAVAIPLRAKLAIGVLLLVLLVASVRFLRQMKEHWSLEGLRVEEVSGIDVGDKSYTSREDLTRLVESLRESQWFSSSHGGWAKEVPLTIHLRSREERRYRVALYLKEKGAVIIFSSLRSNGSESRYGYAFSRSLPGILSAAGTPLPAD